MMVGGRGLVMAAGVTVCSWQRLAVSEEELNLDFTLGSGQAFLWRRDDSTQSWTGPIRNKLFSLRRISCDELEYWVQPDDAASSLDQDTDTAASTILHNYFRLGHSLHSLYKQWASSDTNFALKSASCRGIRLLNQHPLESLVAFICSSNNNIQRIHSMMIKLTEAFGTHLGCHGDQDYYGFPSLSSLCVAGVESRLRDMGFGYRAKYVHQTSLKLSQELGGEKWLEDLKKIPYQDAWQLLQQFPGVGGKVADCVCLMGLGHMTAVPVDVHVCRLAIRDYASHLPPHLAALKSLSTANYKIIGDHFRSLFGEKAGWAQAVLFTAEINRDKSSKRTSQTEHSSPQIAKKIKLSKKRN